MPVKLVCVLLQKFLRILQLVLPSICQVPLPAQLFSSSMLANHQKSFSTNTGRYETSNRVPRGY